MGLPAVPECAGVIAKFSRSQELQEFPESYMPLLKYTVSPAFALAIAVAAAQGVATDTQEAHGAFPVGET